MVATAVDATHHCAGDRLQGVECHLASGAVHALADAWALDPDPLLRDAARRIVEPLVSGLDDPCADVAAAAVRRYRLGFADDHFDARLRTAVASWPTATPEEHLVLPARNERAQHGPGVGRRKDMVRWYVADADGALRPSTAISPAAATLAWELTGDAAWAHHALALAAHRTGVALRGLRSGREHADMGSSVAAVMAGNGRCWGIGAVTGCLQPLLLGGDVEAGVLAPALAYREDALVRHDLDGAQHVPLT